MEKTLSIIKPDATGKNLIGKIVARFEARIVDGAIRKVHVKTCCRAPMQFIVHDRSLGNLQTL